MKSSEESKRKNIATVLVALAMSIFTFLYVSYENSTYIQSTNPNGGASIQSQEVLTNIPIEINIDRDQYFVSGVPETATVTLQGPQSILIQTMGTQSIVAETPDLNELGPGTHTINLEVNDLPSSVTYEVEPAQISITIEERVTETFDVSLNFDESYIADGYTAGEPTLSQETVEVTGLQSAVDSISRVEIVVPEGESPYTSDIVASLPVVLYDENGEFVDVNVNPGEITVTIPIEGMEKTVPISLEVTGEDSNTYIYDVQIANGQASEVTLIGPEDVLNAIMEITAEVDVSGITEDDTVTATLNIPDGVNNQSIEEVEVSVEITPVNETNEPIGTDTSESSSSSEETSESINDSETSQDNEE